MVDKRTNRLLLRDNRAATAELEKWVSQMDLPVAQVELAAHIVTINEKSLRKLGVKWTLADATQAGSVGDVTTLPVIYLSPPPPHASGLTSGALTDACWIWSCQRWNKSSSWILSPAPAAGFASTASQYQARQRNSLSGFQRRKRRDLRGI